MYQVGINKGLIGSIASPVQIVTVYDCLGKRLAFIARFVQNTYRTAVAQSAEGLNVAAGVACK